MNIPKIIWSFWHTTPLPPTVVEWCIETWKRRNRDYQIIILNNTTYTKYIDNIDVASLKHANDFNHTRFSDFVRINVLAKYGGVWIDSSCVCTTSISHWLDKVTKKHRRNGDNYVEFVGFYLSSFTVKSPVIENWFFACVPQSKFMAQWRNEFMSTNMFDHMDDYIASVIAQGVDISGIPVGLRNYLAMHVAAQVVLHGRIIPRTLVLLDAIEPNVGPLYYLQKYKFHSTRALRKLKTLEAKPIIKFRGSERQIMEQNPKLLKRLKNFLVNKSKH